MREQLEAIESGCGVVKDRGLFACYFSIPANVFAKVWTSPGHRAET